MLPSRKFRLIKHDGLGIPDASQSVTKYMIKMEQHRLHEIMHF